MFVCCTGFWIGWNCVLEQIVDEKGAEVGKEKGKQYQEVEEELAVANGYGELYEPVDINGFDELPLPEGVITALTVDMGFEKPSRIQGLTLPNICNEPYPSLVAQVTCIHS